MPLFNAAPNDTKFLRIPNARFTRNFGVLDRTAVAFLDTPFAAQVHLPVASLWGGRVTLRAAESNISSADILWGLPEAGSQNILHITGVRFPAVRIPQPSQAYRMQLALHLRGGPSAPGDNTVVRGAGPLLHVSRDIFRD